MRKQSGDHGKALHRLVGWWTADSVGGPLWGGSGNNKMNVAGSSSSSGWFRRRCDNWIKPQHEAENKELTSICNWLQDIVESTARLVVTPIGVNVDVSHGHLNPDAQAEGTREGVEDVHEVCVVGRQPPVNVHPFKHGPSRIQTYSTRGSQNQLGQGLRVIPSGVTLRPCVQNATVLRAQPHDSIWQAWGWQSRNFQGLLEPSPVLTPQLTQ